MLFNASDMNVLRKKISRCDELAERMRSAEAAGDQTDAAGAGLAFDAEMEWLGPECVTFCKQAIDEGIVRKAAAFDRLSALLSDETYLLLGDFGSQCKIGTDPDCYDGGTCKVDYEAQTLLEAVEQLPQAKGET